MLGRRRLVTSPGQADDHDPSSVAPVSGGITMRPVRIIAAIVLATAVAATGSYLAVSTATHPSAASQPPAPASPVSSAPTAKPQPGTGADTPRWTTSPRGDRPAPGRCDTSALEGSVQGSDGAAGTIYTTIGLRNVSDKTCTVKGIPQVRLVGAQGQSMTPPSKPEGPTGSLVVLRPGQAASFEFHYPNACDSTVAGSRLRVTLPAGRGSVVVPLGAVARFGTCASVGVRTLKPSRPLPDPNDRAPVDRQALIYAAVLRQYLTSGDHSFGDHRFPQVFVLDHTVAGTGAPGHGAPGGGPIPAAVRRAISQALAEVGPLSFVGSRDAVIEEPNGCAQVRDDGILVTLGPVLGSGDRVQVGVNGFVACLGANSLTYLVERTSHGWAVSGITALGPVA
jgi:hypothetical protein